jgi:type II secretory pathway component PulF
MAREKTVFPSIMVQTIRAGEKSGSLEQVLGEVADFYEKEVEFSLKNLTSLIEPVLMLVIGVVVGIMVIIMIAPIYSIIGGLQQTIQQP